MVNAEITALERRTRLTSAGFTTGLMATFLIFSMVWRGCMIAPPPEEIGSGEFELGGIVDYGDGQMGSMDINNFQQAAPRPTAANQPAGQAAPTPAPTRADEPLTQDGPSPVTESAKPQEPEKTTPAPPQLPKVEQASYPTQPIGGGGGSNHGDATSGTGNAGVASAEKLDPNGLYSFTEGGAGGLKGRKALYFKDPSYTVQEEGELYFEFIIEADGTVSNVKMAKLSNKPGLVQAGKEAISKWRFSPIPAGEAQVQQTVRVKIMFKLRG